MRSVLIFSGYNPRAILAFIRTLEARGISYAIIAKRDDDCMYLTNYSKYILAKRLKTQIDAQDIIRAIREVKSISSVDEYIIAPSTEALNRFFLDNKEIMSEQGCFVPLVEKKTYELISDKLSFSNLCKQYDINIPLEYKNTSDIKLPCVAKPKKYFSSEGLVYKPVIIFDAESEINTLAKYKADDFYFQEYVGGDSYYLLYYFHTDGKICKSSQINYIQQQAGGSILAACSDSFHLSKESEKYEQMLRDNKYNGLVMVEVKKYNGKYFMIEANPRFWGPSQLFVDQGSNLFECLLHDNGFIDSHANFETSREVRYYWSGGFTDSKKITSDIVFHSYNLQSFIKDKDLWESYDIYNRADSEQIYKQELEK